MSREVTICNFQYKQRRIETLHRKIGKLISYIRPQHISDSYSAGKHGGGCWLTGHVTGHGVMHVTQDGRWSRNVQVIDAES